MFKRLTHAHSLTLAIWFLFRNMKTSTEFSYLKTTLVFFTPANMQNMPLWSQVLLSSQSGPWVLSAGTGVRVLFGVNMISNRQLPRQTSYHSHPTSNPDNKVTRNPSKLPITSLPQEDWHAKSSWSFIYDHKTLKCWDVVLTWEKQAQIWLATNKSPFPSIFVDMNPCPIPPPNLKPIRNHYIPPKKRQAKWD